MNSIGGWSRLIKLSYRGTPLHAACFCVRSSAEHIYFLFKSFYLEMEPRQAPVVQRNLFLPHAKQNTYPNDLLVFLLMHAVMIKLYAKNIISISGGVDADYVSIITSIIDIPKHRA